jgi:hypothetical protein
LSISWTFLAPVGTSPERKSSTEDERKITTTETEGAYFLSWLSFLMNWTD